MTGAMYSLYLHTDQWNWVEERAKLVGITPSALIRAILDTAMNVDSPSNDIRNGLYQKITEKNE